MFEESAKLVFWLVPIILIGLIFLPQMIRILREYERAVIFRLGKLLGTKGPGLIFLIPIVDRMVRMPACHGIGCASSKLMNSSIVRVEWPIVSTIGEVLIFTVSSFELT
jgi:hypothetical protein